MYNTLKKIQIPENNVWVSYPAPNPNAKMRLFCFPYAGGSGHVFISWKDKLPKDVELGLIQIPGRGTRITEQPYTDIEALVEALAVGLMPELNKPFAFFGHSMGSVVSFELARYLRRKQVKMPQALFAAGRMAPQIRDEDRKTFDLPKDQLIEEIKRLNGTPAEVLENQELMDMVLPILRADFQVCETYAYRSELPLACPITAFGGIDDANVNQESLSAWQHQTTGRFDSHWVEGDHFFLHSSRDQLLSLLSHEMNKLIAGYQDQAYPNSVLPMRYAGRYVTA